MDFQPTQAQNEVMLILVELIGFTGVHRRDPDGEDAILDLLPAAHTVSMGGQNPPFLVRIRPDGVMSVEAE
jgi:hypothetical protein